MRTCGTRFMADIDRKERMSRVKTVVVKVGTKVLSDRADRLDVARVGDICDQVHELRRRGLTVVVVSSGAIGAGMAELGMKKRPTTLPELQAAAAVGQSHLMTAYDANFRKHGYRAGQVLLTREAVNDRVRYLNTRNAIHAMFRLDVVRVINENDTISVDEITFSDNDYLAAMVTNLLRADLLVLLSMVEGVESPTGEVVDVVTAEDERVKGFARAEKTLLGKGGMSSKLEAADIARSSGEMVVIANGRRPGVLVDIVEGKRVGTLLLPSERKLSSRARWIGFGARPRGTLVIDDGARRALVERGKSLLPSGVVRVEGGFETGSVVDIVDGAGRTVARGLANYPADAARKIAGHKSGEIPAILGGCPYTEIVHRDNLVVL
jgi:glutamate 5-kinase